MKKNIFVSTFAAFAVAFTLAAITPTPAHAQWGAVFEEANRNREHISTTCNRDWHHACDESLQEWVLIVADDIHSVYAPLALVQGSDGVDEDARNWLEQKIEENGEDSPYARVSDRIFGDPTGLNVVSLPRITNIITLEDEVHQQATADNRSAILDLDLELERVDTAIGRQVTSLNENLGLVMDGMVTADRVVNENRKGIEENRKGISLAYALSNVPSTLSSNSRGAISGGLGHYENENAVAFGVTFRFTPKLTGNVGGGFDTGSGSSVSGARAGLVWEFGNMGN